ncbi:isocitrate lyase [Kwoniella dendrophila CBS 6074]|uniref:methylisocitrate lyase n=1 Tax=Kwoniella dendrophila CBS 6074 TaxID=1295534 RepID=A0AAX4JXN1_9TREE
MSEAQWLSPTSIEEWWSTTSQKGVKRPYSADTVASLRDVFPESHHSNAMATKLRQRLGKSQKDHLISLLSQSGSDILYVAEDASAEHSNSTISKRVSSIYRSQLHQARTARQSQDGDGNSTLIPIIADASIDSGDGQHIAVMKLVKNLVQSGVSGFHLDDLVPGTKRHSCNVLVPTNEYLKRLVAAKLQLDIMGSEVVSIAKTDAETATHISSTIDYRDRPFILGATVDLPHHYRHAEGNSGKDEWKREAKLKTLDEAFQSDHPGLYERFIEQTKNLNASEALLVAVKLSPSFYWNYESPRTSEGWYAYKGGIEAALTRSSVVADIVDVIWNCAHTFDVIKAETFARGIQNVHPGKWLAYSAAEQNDQDQLKEQLASLGYVWLYLPESKGSTGSFAHHADGTNSEWWWKTIGKVADDAASTISRRK